MLAPLTFSIARKLGVSTSAAFLAGCFAAFDMMNVLESRHILVDSQLMFYCALSLWLGLKWFKRCNEVGVQCGFCHSGSRARTPAWGHVLPRLS
jgi:dolichyl-phosphate-mannose--protein O-mannosyl transferase